MSTDVARGALAAGHWVAAAGRNPQSVAEAIGPGDDLLVAKLDLTDRADSTAVVQAALHRFGRVDVPVSNAGNFYAVYFEEVSPDSMRAQLETNLFGPMNITRAVLPVMRRQRSGHVITITSTAALVGQEFSGAYQRASSVSRVGWCQCADIEPYGIYTTIVEPGYFRTDLLVEDSSMIWPALSIDDYAERTTQRKAMLTPCPKIWSI
jgi:NAD(P)-dependent dehydrogenase (short-subunit alcohol dehydrogenase family)